MIDPASSWFEIVELPVLESPNTSTAESKSGTKAHKQTKEAYFDKSSAMMISTLVNKTWFSRYPRCSNIIYDNGSEFKLHFRLICVSSSLKRRNDQLN